MKRIFTAVFLLLSFAMYAKNFRKGNPKRVVEGRFTRPVSNNALENDRDSLVLTPYGYIPSSRVFHVDNASIIKEQQDHLVAIDKQTGKVKQDFGAVAPEDRKETNPYAFAAKLAVNPRSAAIAQKMAGSPSAAVAAVSGAHKVSAAVAGSSVAATLATSNTAAAVTHSNDISGTNFPGFYVSASLDSVQHLSTTWIVPNYPKDTTGPTYFIWNALSGGAIQPVLEYNNGRGKKYALRCWYFAGGKYVFGNTVIVQPGTQVQGVVNFVSKTNDTTWTYQEAFTGYDTTSVTLVRTSQAASPCEDFEPYESLMTQWPDQPYVAMTNIAVTRWPGALPPPDTLKWKGYNNGPRTTPSGANSVIVNSSSSNGEVRFYFGDSTGITPDSTFQIVSALNDTSLLGIPSTDTLSGAVTQLQTPNPAFTATNECWQFISLDSSRLYKIINRNTDSLVLSNPTATSQIAVTADSGNAAQQWLLTPLANGYCTMSPVSNPSVFLTVVGSSTANGTSLDLEPASNSAGQQFKFPLVVTANMITAAQINQIEQEDTVAGGCVTSDSTSANVTLGKVPINSNTFSISCWIKPKRAQRQYANFLSTRYTGSGAPNASTGFGIGFGPGNNNTQVYYMDSLMQGHKSASGSGLYCDSTKWNYVVLTYAPTGVMIYVNGIGAQVNSAAALGIPSMPILNLSQNPFVINLSVIYGYISRLNAFVDEVKFYNYTLSQSEIRQKMHLITPVSDENGLIGYYQFNHFTSNNITCDLVSDNTATIAAASRVVSNAPVGSGTVYANTDVTAGAEQDFPGTGVSLFWNADSTAPNGEVVAFHLNNSPDSLPNGQSMLPGGYYILENYGSNSIFSVPDSIRFGNLNLDSGNDAYTLYKRPGTDYLNSWMDLGQPYNNGGNTLSWKSPAGLTSFSQLIITASQGTLPITLASFNAVPKKNNITLNWLTATEVNTLSFELQRSVGNGNHFSAIATLSAKNNGGSNSYSYTDNHVEAGVVYYYRLKVLSGDGTYFYSDITTASVGGNSRNVIVYPNPVKGNLLNVEIESVKNTSLNFVLFDINGTAVYRAAQNVSAGKNTISLRLPRLAPGTYMLKISGNEANNLETKVLIE